MVPALIDQHEQDVFCFNLGKAVHKGLRYESSLYVLFFSAKEGAAAFTIGLAQGKLGYRTVITENGEIFEVWIEAKQSTCPYWDILNKASLGDDLPNGWAAGVRQLLTTWCCVALITRMGTLKKADDTFPPVATSDRAFYWLKAGSAAFIPALRHPW